MRQNALREAVLTLKQWRSAPGTYTQWWVGKLIFHTCAPLADYGRHLMSRAISKLERQPNVRPLSPEARLKAESLATLTALHLGLED